MKNDILRQNAVKNRTIEHEKWRFLETKEDCDRKDEVFHHIPYEYGIILQDVRVKEDTDYMFIKWYKLHKKRQVSW